MKREITKTVVEEGKLPEMPVVNPASYTIHPPLIFRPERMILVHPPDDEPDPKVTLDDVNWRLVGRGRRRK